MSWPEGIYSKAKIKDLILVALFECKEEVSFEDLLMKCFSLFPGKFSLDGYDENPDSRRLGRPLRLLREDGFVEGNPEDGFYLTGTGEKRASRSSEVLRQSRLDV